MPQCPRCRRDVPEIAHSCALGEVCCEDCHPNSRKRPGPPIRTPRVSPPKRPQPTPYAREMRRAWAGLERVGPVYSAGDGSGRISGYCPACKDGLVVLRVHGDFLHPRLRVEPCSLGCDTDVIVEALKTA